MSELAMPVLTPLARIPTPKGDVLHALKAGETSFAGFGEAYFSTVNPGAIKGWKRHARMTLNLVVPVGRIAFVIHDDRPGSPVQGQFQRIEIGEHNYQRLTVPPGVWMAFQGLGQELNLLLNVASIPHDPNEADSIPLEQLGYDWPCASC